MGSMKYSEEELVVQGLLYKLIEAQAVDLQLSCVPYAAGVLLGNETRGFLSTHSTARDRAKNKCEEFIRHCSTKTRIAKTRNVSCSDDGMNERVDSLAKSVEQLSNTVTLLVEGLGGL